MSGGPATSDDGSERSKQHENVFGGINLLNSLLRDLDERGLILSLAAFAEDSLGTLLNAFMLPTEATRQLLEGFNAPLGTFSSRIRASCALGLITKEQFDDLERLRKIRNEFSHSWRPVSLSDARILGHVKAINYNNVDDEFPETPIQKIRGALSFLLVELQVATDQIAKKGYRVSVTGTRLIAGIDGTVDEQIAACRKKLNELDAELPIATGDKRGFLTLVRMRWIEKLVLIESLAPQDRRVEIRAVRLGFEK